MHNTIQCTCTKQIYHRIWFAWFNRMQANFLKSENFIHCRVAPIYIYIYIYMTMPILTHSKLHLWYHSINHFNRPKSTSHVDKAPRLQIAWRRQSGGRQQLEKNFVWVPGWEADRYTVLPSLAKGKHLALLVNGVKNAHTFSNRISSQHVAGFESMDKRARPSNYCMYQNRDYQMGWNRTTHTGSHRQTVPRKMVQPARSIQQEGRVDQGGRSHSNGSPGPNGFV